MSLLHRLPHSLIAIAVASALASALAHGEESPTMLAKVRSTAEAESYGAPLAASTKTATLLRDVPQSISVITRQTIDDLSMQNLGDAVAYVPGVGMAQGEAIVKRR